MADILRPIETYYSMLKKLGVEEKTRKARLF